MRPFRELTCSSHYCLRCLSDALKKRSLTVVSDRDLTSVSAISTLRCNAKRKVCLTRPSSTLHCLPGHLHNRRGERCIPFLIHPVTVAVRRHASASNFTKAPSQSEPPPPSPPPSSPEPKTRRSSASTSSAYQFPLDRALEHLQHGVRFHQHDAERRQERLEKLTEAAQRVHAKDPAEEAAVESAARKAVKCEKAEAEAWQYTRRLQAKRREEEREVANRFIKYHSHHILVSWKQRSAEWKAREEAGTVPRKKEKNSFVERDDGTPSAPAESFSGGFSTSSPGPTASLREPIPCSVLSSTELQLVVNYLLHGALLLRLSGLYEVAEQHVERLLQVLFSATVYLSQSFAHAFFKDRWLQSQQGSGGASSSSHQPRISHFSNALTVSSWTELQWTILHYCEAVQLWELQCHDSSALFSQKQPNEAEATVFTGFTATLKPFTRLVENTATLLRRLLQSTRWGALVRTAHPDLLQLSTGSKAARRQEALQWFGLDEEMLRRCIRRDGEIESDRLRTLPASCLVAQQRQLQLLPLLWLSGLCTYQASIPHHPDPHTRLIGWDSLRRGYTQLLQVYSEDVGLEPLSLALLQVVLHRYEQPEEDNAGDATCSGSSPTLAEMMSILSMIERRGLLPGTGEGAALPEQQGSCGNVVPLRLQESVRSFVRQWVLDWEGARRRRYQQVVPSASDQEKKAAREEEDGIGPYIRTRRVFYTALRDVPLCLVLPERDTHSNLALHSSLPPLPQELERGGGPSTAAVLLHTVTTRLMSLLLQWLPPDAPTRYTHGRESKKPQQHPLHCSTTAGCSSSGRFIPDTFLLHYLHHHRLYRDESLLLAEALVHLRDIWQRLQQYQKSQPHSLSCEQKGFALLQQRVKLNSTTTSDTAVGRRSVEFGKLERAARRSTDRAVTECAAVLQAVVRSLALQQCGLVQSLLTSTTRSVPPPSPSSSPPSANAHPERQGAASSNASCSTPPVCILRLPHAPLTSSDLHLLHLMDRVIREVLCDSNQEKVLLTTAKHNRAVTAEGTDTRSAHWKPQLNQMNLPEAPLDATQRQLLQLPLLYVQFMGPLLSAEPYDSPYQEKGEDER